MRQEQWLAHRLFAHGFVHMVCSDSLRARMTAVPLAPRLRIRIEEGPLLLRAQFCRPARQTIRRIDRKSFWTRLRADERWRLAEIPRARRGRVRFIVTRRHPVKGTLVALTMVRSAEPSSNGTLRCLGRRVLEVRGPNLIAKPCRRRQCCQRANETNKRNRCLIATRLTPD